MKKLQFKKLWIVSEASRSAFKVSFHSKMTLLVGKNHTGKSTLVKHIFRTLGCETLGKSDRWDPLALSVLEFEYDGLSYYAYRRANVYGLKSSHHGWVKVTTSYKKWSQIVSDFFDFGLMLATHQDTMALATPPYLFLPFYIDQDGGWAKNWNSFDKLTQFADWKKPLISYVTGQRPNEYYRAKFNLAKAKSAASELNQELKVVQSALARVNKSLPSISISLDPDAFQHEIEVLLQESTKLNEHQEKIRAKTFTLGSERQLLQSQISIAKTSLRELEGDLKYLTDTKPQESILCPTCGIEHENGFSVRLELIDNAGQLRNIIAELEDDLRKVEEDQVASTNELNALRATSNEIEQTLQHKKGSLKLQDIVESQSAAVVRTAFTNDIDSLEIKLTEHEAEVVLYKEKLEKFDLPERTKEINEYYSEHIELFLSELGVADVREDLKKRPDASLISSGSALPRTILAYQFAVLHTAKEKGDAKLFPIVVDSPNQQGQDTEHLSQMLLFIAKRVPSEQQLILAVEEDPNMEFEGSKVELNNPYSLLNSELYDVVYTELNELVNEMNKQVDLSLSGALKSDYIG